MIKRVKSKNFKQHFLLYVYCLATLFDALIVIISLGFFTGMVSTKIWKKLGYIITKKTEWSYKKDDESDNKFVLNGEFYI